MNKISDKQQNKIIGSRQNILKNASELFSEFGFLGVSMSDIAEKLNMTKAALYYHFESKKELYLNVLDNTFEELKKFIDEKISEAESREEIIFKAIEGYLEFGLKEKNLIKSSFFKSTKKDLEVADYIANLKKKVNLLFQNYLKRKEPNFISFLLGTIDTMVIEASLLNKKLRKKNIISKIFKIFFPAYEKQN